jgi:hypothetical protein
MKIGVGRKITLSYREATKTAKATLVIDVATDEGDLPHEHREDLRQLAAEVMGVPLSAIPPDIEVELKKRGGDHSHDHDHGHAHPAQPSSKSEPEREKLKA